MPVSSDTDLYSRGAETLLASWEQYARGAAGARLVRLEGVAVGVFPSGAERAVYNNALLARDLGPGERAAAVEAMRDAYRSAGVDRYAAWVHEGDEAMCSELAGRGYRVEETTRAMGMEVDELITPEADFEPGRPDWPSYVAHLATLGVPDGLLAGADPDAFDTIAAPVDGRLAASAISIDHDRDCGIYNMSTVEQARRRGLATALTARLVSDAAARGCRTASLQATPMAERVYASVGFRDLGRLLEFVPS